MTKIPDRHLQTLAEASLDPDLTAGSLLCIAVAPGEKGHNSVGAAWSPGFGREAMSAALLASAWAWVHVFQADPCECGACQLRASAVMSLVTLFDGGAALGRGATKH